MAEGPGGSPMNGIMMKANGLNLSSGNGVMMQTGTVPPSPCMNGMMSSGNGLASIPNNTIMMQAAIPPPHPVQMNGIRLQSSLNLNTKWN